MIKSFIRDQSAAAAAEYALILAIIGMAVAGAAYNLGTAMANAMDSVDQQMTSPASTSGNSSSN
jgi:pilus assembly protein Flp/PilA